MKSIPAFRKQILSWYARHGRDLPWRKTKDPYAILLSEVMLQQTQVERVIPYYLRWMRRFPDFLSLSRAAPKTVLSFWSGLGYNNRALRLLQLAKTVVKEHDGILPGDEAALRRLPGIGPYTAAAIMAFAHNKHVAVIDTNIRRVLIHELNLPEHIGKAELEAIARKCIPKGRSRLWHNALMDYGAKEKTARKTGIRSVSKQSRFEGSQRQVRGAIVRLLLEENSVSLRSLQTRFPREDLFLILAKMEREKMIRKKKRSYILA
ncbi:MAG: A/G-specific adenine glycosylase [DPANN group archaeon]|nr:A/G-specific adenine glycosylase [DPANN group archaeon]